MLAEVWDGVTPLRQVGLGVSKLTHEDARMLAYERKAAPPETREE